MGGEWLFVEQLNWVLSCSVSASQKEGGTQHDRTPKEHGRQETQQGCCVAPPWDPAVQWACDSPVDVGLKQHTEDILQSLASQVTMFPNGRPPAERGSKLCLLVLVRGSGSTCKHPHAPNVERFHLLKTLDLSGSFKDLAT